MSALEATLTPEEQALFDSMGGEKPAPAKDTPKAEAPKDEAKAAAKEPAKDAPKDEQAKKESVVPAAALKEAREQNKALHKELDGLKALVAAGDTKLAKFMEAVSKKAESAAPKFEDDPAGALKAENEALKKGLEEVQKRLAAQDEGAKGATAMQQFAAKVQAAEKEFAKENPDYWKAADFVAAAWRDEFSDAGFEDAEIPERVFQKSMGMTHKAMQSGRDPAEAIYKIAKRLGFQKPAPEAKDEKAAKSDGESKLESIKKGQEIAKVNGGGNGPEDLTLKSLAQMDDDQIERLVADPDWWSKNVRRSPIH